MARPASNLIFIGLKGTLIALDRATGGEAWRRPLKGSGFVNVVLDGDDLIATTRGEVFCLDPATGRLRWANDLPGMGWGLAAIATADGSSAVLMAEKMRQEQEAANGAAAGSM